MTDATSAAMLLIVIAAFPSVLVDSQLLLATIGERLARNEEFTAKLRDMDFYHGPVGAHARRGRNGVGGRSVCGSAVAATTTAATWGSLSRRRRRSPEAAKLQLLCAASSSSQDCRGNARVIFLRH